MDKSEARTAKEARLASLYEEYYDKIARYIYVHIGNRIEAEDLAGDVFLKALKSLDKFEQRDVPMQAWLYKIAHNLVVDHLRKAQKHRTTPLEDVEIESGENPVESAEKSIDLAMVEKAMENLSNAQREVVRLRFFSGLSSKEVGQLLGKSDGAVREMQRAAIESLRVLLAVNRNNG